MNLIASKKRKRQWNIKEYVVDLVNGYTWLRIAEHIFKQKGWKPIINPETIIRRSNSFLKEERDVSNSIEKLENDVKKLENHRKKFTEKITITKENGDEVVILKELNNINNQLTKTRTRTKRTKYEAEKKIYEDNDAVERKIMMIDVKILKHKNLIEKCKYIIDKIIPNKIDTYNCINGRKRQMSKKCEDEFTKYVTTNLLLNDEKVIEGKISK
jgi:hypothetical protein